MGDTHAQRERRTNTHLMANAKSDAVILGPSTAANSIRTVSVGWEGSCGVATEEEASE